MRASSTCRSRCRSASRWSITPERPLRSVGRPIYLDDIACDFPELKLIGIHVGIPWHDEMIAMAWKHPNVFIGSDAHSPKYWPASFMHYINSYGQDKVLFGTDYPVLDFKRTMDEIDALRLNPEAKQLLLRDNALQGLWSRVETEIDIHRNRSMTLPALSLSADRLRVRYCSPRSRQAADGTRDHSAS